MASGTSRPKSSIQRTRQQFQTKTQSAELPAQSQIRRSVILSLIAISTFIAVCLSVLALFLTSALFDVRSAVFDRYTMESVSDKLVFLLVFGAWFFLIVFGSFVLGYALSLTTSRNQKKLVTLLLEHTSGAPPQAVRWLLWDEFARLGVDIEKIIGLRSQRVRELGSRLLIRRDLLARIVHDLRGPVAGLRLAIEALSKKDGDRPVETSDMISAIQSSLDAHSNLLKELNPIGDLEIGPDRMTVTKVSLKALLDEIVLRESPRARARGIDLVRDGLNEEVEVLVDRSMIDRVIANLIGNAIRHTSSGGTITVALNRRESGAEVSIGDTGCGIPAAHLSAIFDPFFTTQSGGPGSKGAGLGLSIVKRFLELHGATISVSSTEGVGTTFSFTLRTTGDMIGNSSEGKSASSSGATASTALSTSGLDRLSRRDLLIHSGATILMTVAASARLLTFWHTVSREEYLRAEDTIHSALAVLVAVSLLFGACGVLAMVKIIAPFSRQTAVSLHNIIRTFEAGGDLRFAARSSRADGNPLVEAMIGLAHTVNAKSTELAIEDRRTRAIALAAVEEIVFHVQELRKNAALLTGGECDDAGPHSDSLLTLSCLVRSEELVLRSLFQLACLDIHEQTPELMVLDLEAITTEVMLETIGAGQYFQVFPSSQIEPATSAHGNPRIIENVFSALFQGMMRIGRPGEEIIVTARSDNETTAISIRLSSNESGGSQFGKEPLGIAVAEATLSHLNVALVKRRSDAGAPSYTFELPVFSKDCTTFSESLSRSPVK